MKRAFRDLLQIVLILLLFCLINTGLAFSEEAITAFDEKFAVSLFGNYNIGIFEQHQQETVSYRTDKPWNIGLGIAYNKISAQISVPLSFNSYEFDLEINSYFEKIYYGLFVKHYNYFFNKKETEFNNAGLDILAAGITAGWIHNNQNHSLSSVYDLDEKQNITSGSFLYGFGIFYTSIYSENTLTKHYDERNHLIHFGPTGGYSYTWILPKDMFVNVSITIGANMGINVSENKLLFIPQVTPKISYGHHNRTWSVNAVIGTNASFILWDKNDFDIFAPSTMTVTFSKRF